MPAPLEGEGSIYLPAHAEREGVYAVIRGCGYIGGDGSGVADAMNTEAPAQRHT